MTRHIFIEKTPGFVSHTAASKVLAENQLVQDFVGIQTEEKFKASAFVSDSCSDRARFSATNTMQTVDALSKWNGAVKPNQTVSILTKTLKILRTVVNFS